MRALERLVSPGLLIATLLIVLVVDVATMAPLASAEPSPSPSPRSSASASASSSAVASKKPSQRARAKARHKGLVRDVTDPDLATTIHDRPVAFSLDRDPTFTFSAPNDPGQQLRFECILTREDLGTPLRDTDCTTGSNSADGVTTAQVSYTDRYPSPSTYTFTVQARDADTGAAGPVATYHWHLYTAWSPLHVAPRGGPTFNNPLGKKPAQRRNLAQVIRTIRSMPGYRQPYDSSAACPSTVAAAPSVVRVSLYSMTDGSFASAMLHAARRCVSVQLLMNNHLSVRTDPAFRRLRAAVGFRTTRPSFARRCSYGCRGRGVLHTKMFLFDSQLPSGTAGATNISNTVMFGSSNMTQNAARVQWNDLFTVRRNAALFSSYNRYYAYMKKDAGFRRTKDPWSNIGRYRTTFWPVRPKSRDPEIAALRSIRCTKVGNAGVAGRTDVYINMHAWFGARGHSFLKRVRSLYSRGCRIHILYSFMTQGVFNGLKHGTNGRMSVRRTIYSLDGDRFADVYSHFKSIAVSGNVGGHPSSRMVWTGSNNFTPDGNHFDELMVRINSGPAFRAYRAHFRYMQRRKSSATYARFFEPFGGGRAPRKTDNRLTILSPDAHVDDDGNPRAVD